MNEKMERVKKRIDEIKKDREELREKYDYLVEQMKKTVDKHSQEIEFLKNELGGLGNKEVKEESDISDIRSVINSLQKSITSLEGKHAALKEKLKGEVELAKESLNSDISERMKIIQSNLVDDIKNEIDKNLEGLQSLEKEMKKTQERHDKHEERISGLRSSINSLSKPLANIESRYSILKEKVTEDMKSISKDINSHLIEKVKVINANIKTQLKDSKDKNFKDIKSLKEDVEKLIEKGEGYGYVFSDLENNVISIKKSLSELEGRQNVLKEELNEKVNLLDKEINSELAKVRGFEERLNKDIEDFEKFANNQKAVRDKFESGISDKIDIFAMEKENLKRDFTSISNDFKNMGNRLDSLKEKDSDISQRLQNTELDLENFKKVTEDILTKVKEEQIVFKGNLVAKLNESSDKILNRLSQNEIKNSSELAKQSEEIKLFRAHVTQFINDLVSNYEKRFVMMKSEIDQALKLMEERAKEQRAMIFE